LDNPLAGRYLKLDRAENSWQRLKGKASAFLAIDTPYFIDKFDAKRGCQRFYLRQIREPRFCWAM
jgi:hypothetical protein